MNGSIRRSRFQVISLEEGEPRPVYRRLTFVSVGSGTALADSTPSVGDAVHAGFMAARPVKALMSETASVCTPHASLRSQEDVARRAVARKWVACAEAFRGESSVLVPFPCLCGGALCFLFLDREASTLSKHLRGWQKWLEFSRCCGVAPCSPSPIVHSWILLLPWLRVLAWTGGALRFAAHKLGLTGLVDSLASLVLESWLASDKWNAVCPKEAYSLPQWVVAKLEIAFLDCGNEDAWLLGCMLLMIWGGPRWSDAQRLQLATLTIDKSSLRAASAVLAHQDLPQRIGSRSPILWGDSAELGINLCPAIGAAAVALSLARLSFGQTGSSTALCLHAWAAAQMPLSIICRLGAISSIRFFVAQLQGHDTSMGFAAGCPSGHEGRARASSPTERLLPNTVETMCGRNCSVKSAYCLRWPEVGNQPGLCNGDFIQWRKKLVSLLPCAHRQSRQTRKASVKRRVPLRGEPVGPWLVNTKTGWSHRTVSGSDAGVVSDGLRWGLACRILGFLV